MQPWKEALPITKAVKGSSFAIIKHPTDKQVSSIYYQDPELHLRDRHRDYSDDLNHSVWALDEQVPELCPFMNGYPSHFRWLHTWGAATGDPNNGGSCRR